MLCQQYRPAGQTLYLQSVISFQMAVKAAAHVQRRMGVCSVLPLNLLHQKIGHAASYKNNRKKRDLSDDELPVSRKAEV